MRKTDLAIAVIARRRFTVKTVADTLGVPRCQLHSRLRQGSRPQGRYQKTDDAELLASDRTLTDDRPTNGYRRNGKSVRVAFAIDTCDREAMLESVERRFNDQQTPHPVDWLSENGSCYRAHATVSFVQSIGVVPCFTPVRSPQSNGMVESFVKTIKRDIVHDRPDAQSVLARLPRWFEDYNDNHPHRGQQMKSHREFSRSHQQPAANGPVWRKQIRLPRGKKCGCFE